MIDLDNLTILKAREGLDKNEFSSVDLVSAYQNIIKDKNSNLNAFLEVFDDALKQAKEADVRISNGESLPLLGIPFAVKDNILIKGKKATSASKILEGFVSPYDATVISKLKKQGAVFLGRTNMDEFALGGSTENSAFGPTKNPYDEARVSGGTSGGSTASVASGMSLCALGSDTGGSVRQPSSFCGVVGLKPTYGGVSRHGLMAATSSFDVIGPIAKTVGDVETIFDLIKGRDDMDSTTIGEDTYENRPTKSSYVIGVPQSLVNEKGIDPKVKENFDVSVQKLKDLGHQIVDIELPNALSIYYIMNFAEVSSNLSRFDGVKYGLHVDGDGLLGDYLQTRRDGFGKEAKRRIILGTYVLSSGYYDAFYGKAQLARVALRKKFDEVFKKVDLILTPTSPVPAWKIGEKSDPLSMYLEDIFTVTANIVGIPAISIPSGFADFEDKKMPLGIQFMAPHSAENILFDIGKKFLGENNF